ncbi:MAG: GNAT family N-acetyltransferase, partial [Bacilli bacterium]|nr:GNAT family N-acetyltransferase [Bacilli bacterium]
NKIIYKRSDEMPNGDFIHDVLKLDSQVYPRKLQGTFDSVNGRFQRNKQSYILAYDDNQLIGYICFLNIAKNLCEQLHKNPLSNDDLINPNDIIKFSLKEPNTVYIISIVVKKEYRHQGIGGSLVKELRKFLMGLFSKGYKFDCVYGTAVTKAGYKLAKKNGFTIIKRVKLGVYFISLKITSDILVQE